MNAVSPKGRSLSAFLILCAMFPMLLLLDQILPPEYASLKGSPLLLMGPTFFLAGRIRCPHCDNKVVGPWWSGRSGALVLLWMAREKCSKCGEPLGW